MEQLVKRVVGWDKMTVQQRSSFRRRVDVWRYPLFSVIANLVCIFPIPLSLVLRASRSDKHRPGAHRYGYTYGNLFWQFKYRRIKILEIGVGGYERRLGGESLNAWQAYFPFAKIVGCDIEPKQALNTFRTKVYQADQSSKRDLDLLCEREECFDIIVDDGSHLSRHQIFTFEQLFPFVKERGIYVVEDVQTSYWSSGQWDGANVNDPRFTTTCVGYFLNLAKYLNLPEIGDVSGIEQKVLELAASIRQIVFEHNLVVIIKRSSLSA